MKQITKHPKYAVGLQRGRGHREKLRRAYNWWNKPRTIRIKKWKIVIGAYVIYTLLPTPHPAKTIYADPPPVTVAKVKKIEPIKPIDVQPIEQVQPIAVAAPVASTEPSGCVTGYSTSNYALNQIIAHESGGRSCATNAGGCFGLLQACPGEPLRAACGGNPECQIAWFQANKTGGRSWEAIWALWQTQGWW